jgi:hypothetical protein
MTAVTLSANEDMTTGLSDPCKRHRLDALTAGVAVFVVPCTILEYEHRTVEGIPFIQHEHAVTAVDRVPPARVGRCDGVDFWDP